jgi:[protein-PII] uridylyltransferase
MRANFCRDHGIGEDAELVVFLVEQHLTMSQVAQKQDLADPDVILAFAAQGRHLRHLTALYLLTVADIRGTSPKVWNAWKGKLLEDLFRMTAGVLKGSAVLQLTGVAERQEEARRILRYHGLRPDTEVACGTSSTPATSCATPPTRSPGTRAPSTTARPARSPWCGPASTRWATACR